MFWEAGQSSSYTNFFILFVDPRRWLRDLLCIHYIGIYMFIYPSSISCFSPPPGSFWKFSTISAHFPENSLVLFRFCAEWKYWSNCRIKGQNFSLFNPPPLITHASPVTKRKQVRGLADPVCLHGCVIALLKGVRKEKIYWSAFFCCNVCERAEIRDSGMKIVCTWPKWVLHLDTVLLFAVGHRLERSCGSSFVIGGSDYFC